MGRQNTNNTMKYLFQRAGIDKIQSNMAYTSKMNIPQFFYEISRELTFPKLATGCLYIRGGCFCSKIILCGLTTGIQINNYIYVV